MMPTASGISQRVAVQWGTRWLWFWHDSGLLKWLASSHVAMPLLRPGPQEDSWWTSVFLWAFLRNHFEDDSLLLHNIKYQYWLVCAHALFVIKYCKYHPCPYECSSGIWKWLCPWGVYSDPWSSQHDGEKATGSQVGELCCRVKKTGRYHSLPGQ